MGEVVDTFGIPVTTTVRQRTYPYELGTVRKTFAGLLGLEWVYLVVSAINILASAGITAARIYTIVSKAEADGTQLIDNPDFVFCILLLVNGCFCVFYMIHGLFLERNFEVYAYMAAISIVLLYCILEYSINESRRSDLKLGRLIAACVLAPINLVIAALVARDFGWLDFRIIGANEDIQDMYTLACRFFSFLRFDFQISVSIVILVIQSFSLYEKIILGVGLPLTFLWMVFGIVMVRKELSKAVWPFVLIGLLVPAYVIFKIYVVFGFLTDSADSGENRYIYYAILTAAFAALLCRAIIFFELYEVTRNFGKGLAEKAFGKIDISERTSLLGNQRGQTTLRLVT